MVSMKYTLAAFAASLLTMVSADDSATTALTWTSVVTHIPSATIRLPASAMQSIGCFETGIPLQNYGESEFQTEGECQFICLMLDKNVMGLSDGINCWCGDKIPAKEWQVDNSTCDTTCSGYKDKYCGGDTKLWVQLTGNTRNEVQYYEIPSSSSSSSSRITSAASTSSAGQTSSASSTPTESSSNSSGGNGGTNTAAIAAGVVVGVVGVAALIGGVLYFMRRRRQKQAEEDYRRNAANVNDFVAGGKLHTSNSSMNDSRLDPIFIDRRQSNGSIADNEDYSRRILKVTNA